jgi:ATP-binding cassette subfamily B protein
MSREYKSGSKDHVTRETLRLYLREVWRMPVHFTMSYVASMLFVLASDIAVPYLIGSLVDALISPHRSVQHVNNLFWLLVLTAMSATFVFARVTFFFRNKVLTITERRVTTLVFDAYERQEYSFFTNNFVGSLVVRAQRFVRTFDDLYDITLFSLVGLLIQVFAPVIILAYRSAYLSYVFVAVFLLSALVIKITNRFRLPTLHKSAAASSDVTAGLADVLTNNLAMKVFAAGDIERKRFFKIADHRRTMLYHQANVSEAVRVVRSMVGAGFLLGSTFLLVHLALRGKISIGTILIAQLYIYRLEQSLWDMSRISERLEESLADAAEMTEVVLRSPEVQDIDNAYELRADNGQITFKNVNFSYQDDAQNEALFDNLNLVIEPGQKVGLVGPSGGGKTTITKLLLRFMDIQGGTITIDNQNISQVRQDDLRRAISYVPQEPLLFHRSIRENIAYGDPNADDVAIIHAAKLAHADEFINKLPDGYNTLVGERGVKLSGGEKQRVAIARAMLKKSPIVVLDEATSALDSRSEKAIVSALDNLMKGRTTLVIAHRLSTIRKLDRIVVLRDGQITEDGTHEELLKQKGLYADLWQHQSGEFIADE